MHEGEIRLDEDGVRALLREQFPAWSRLPLRPVPDIGTDHVLHRLGSEMLVRLPVVAWAGEQAGSDARWLPGLARRVSTRLPVPLATGRPARGYPWAWSVVPWIPGRRPSGDDSGHALTATMRDLARFARELHDADPTGGPPANGRGTPLADHDDGARRAIAAAAAVHPGLDVAAITAIWEDAVTAAPWAGRPVWMHGDLMPGNVLVDENGHLTGVIDFGSLAVGDPAPDLIPVWMDALHHGAEAFRDGVGYDDDTWRRARGWALLPALQGIPYYRRSVPEFAERGVRTIARLVAEVRD